MEQTIAMEIKDNTFARQFETTVKEGLVSIEYSFQERSGKKNIFNKNQHSGSI